MNLRHLSNTAVLLYSVGHFRKKQMLKKESFILLWIGRQGVDIYLESARENIREKRAAITLYQALGCARTYEATLRHVAQQKSSRRHTSRGKSDNKRIHSLGN